MSGHALIQHQDIGDSFSGTYYVENVFIRQTVNGKDYLDLTLRDRSGSRYAKFWGLERIERGDWAFVAAIVEEYHEKPSIILKNIEKTDEPDSMDNYIPTYDDSDKHAARFDEIREAIKEMESKAGGWTAGMLVDEVYSNSRFFERFITAPGGVSSHYGRRGGLLANTVRIADACLKMSDLYPLTDEEKAILLSSALLCRVGSVEAFEFQDCVPVETKSGILLGIDNLTMTRVSNALKRVSGGLKKSGDEPVNHNVVIRILHAIASFDCGDVVPATKEALILSGSFHNDLEIVEAIEFMEGDVNENDEFTAYDSSMQRRYFTG